MPRKNLTLDALQHFMHDKALHGGEVSRDKLIQCSSPFKLKWSGGGVRSVRGSQKGESLPMVVAWPGKQIGTGFNAPLVPLTGIEPACTSATCLPHVVDRVLAPVRALG